MNRLISFIIFTITAALIIIIGISLLFGEEIRSSVSTSANTLSGHEMETVNQGRLGAASEIPVATPSERRDPRHKSLTGIFANDALGGDIKKESSAFMERAASPIVVRTTMEMELAKPSTPPMRPSSTLGAPDTSRYAIYEDNLVRQVRTEPLSTFSLDMDTASYANLRRYLNDGRLPPRNAVRIEEMLNYFPRDKDAARLSAVGQSPFDASYEVAPSPWNPDRLLLTLTLRAREMSIDEAPPANLVFLVDVSGSMNYPDRLPLVQASLTMLLDRLRPQDKISLVTYSGSTQVVLESTAGSQKDVIAAAIQRLTAGGATAGGAGLQMAYEQAEKTFLEGAINRILLCTDGDFNLGATDSEIHAMVQRNKMKGITLSVLGYGTGNTNDALMVKIADDGNGNYSYIDSLKEAQKVLLSEMSATLVTVAKDTKVQLEFNPAIVSEYRQLGYEKRQLSNEAFDDDRVDAGDIGAGKQVTVLYELKLVDASAAAELLKSISTEEMPELWTSGDIAELRLRWKAPGREESTLARLAVHKETLSAFENASAELRFSAAVAAFGQKLRNNPHVGKTSYLDIERWASAALGGDPNGLRSEFVELVRKAKSLDRRHPLTAQGQ